MFSLYASLFPRLLPALQILEEECSRLRGIVEKETEQRARVGKIMTDWCGNSNMGCTEQRLRKGLLKALASCDEGKEDRAARSCWAPITEYLFRQAQSMVKELDFASAEVAAAIPPAKMEQAQQATSDAEQRLKGCQEKLQEEQKAHAETRHQNMLRLSEMTEEWNAKLRDATQEVCCSFSLAANPKTSHVVCRLRNTDPHLKLKCWIENQNLKQKLRSLHNCCHVQGSRAGSSLPKLLRCAPICSV
jgi:hypothetical protein